MEVARRRRRRKKLLDELKDRRGYSYLKEEALDLTIWRHHFEGGFGPVVRQNTEWMNEGQMFIQERLCFPFICLVIHPALTLWGPRLSYTTYLGSYCDDYSSAFENHGSGIFHFLIAGWCCIPSRVLWISHTCSAIPEHLCWLIYTSLRRRVVPILST